MKTYLGEDAEALDGFEFMVMAEAGEVGHWEVLASSTRAAGERSPSRLVEWALPIQERHLATVSACALSSPARRIHTPNDAGADRQRRGPQRRRRSEAGARPGMFSTGDPLRPGAPPAVRVLYEWEGIVEHDFDTGRERRLTAFPTPDELRHRFRAWRRAPDEESESHVPFTRALRGLDGSIKTPRYYQRIAIDEADRRRVLHPARFRSTRVGNPSDPALKEERWARAP